MGEQCKVCNTEVSLQYCPNCGTPVNLPKINGQYIRHEIEQLFQIERGFFYTVNALATNPGKTVNTFLTENRNRLVKPIVFIIITSLLYSVLNHYFHIEEGYVQSYDLKDSTAGLILKWVQDNYGYSNIIMGLFIALWIKLLFRKYDYSFFEILVLLCFVMGMGMLIFSIFVVLQGLTQIKLMTLAGIVGITYAIWAIGHFYDRYKAMSYVKALIAYMTGMITFWLTAFLVGNVIDLIIKP
jgi:hypothetical protein